MLRSLFLAIYVLAFSLGNAHAQSANTFMIKVGYNHFFPNVKSGEITGIPGSAIDVGDSGNAIASLGYSITDHWNLEFTVGLPPKSSIKADGSIAQVGKIATAKIAPPALSLQYRFFNANASLRPYVGAAVVHSSFPNVKSEPILTQLTNPGGPTTRVSIDSKFATAVQVGAVYSITDDIFLDAAVIQFFIKTMAHLSTGQSVTARVNPLGVNASIGYRF